MSQSQDDICKRYDSIISKINELKKNDEVELVAISKYHSPKK